LTECRFKTALRENNHPRVASILNHARLYGESIIDCLERQGHVDDPNAKFRLAIAAGDLETAFDSALKIDNPLTPSSLKFPNLLSEHLMPLKLPDSLSLQSSIWLNHDSAPSLSYLTWPVFPGEVVTNIRTIEPSDLQPANPLNRLYEN
jgi:hypothetical protein